MISLGVINYGAAFAVAGILLGFLFALTLTWNT